MNHGELSKRLHFMKREAALFQILNEKNSPTDKWEIQLSKYHVSDINRTAFDDYLKKAKAAGRLAVESDEPESVLNSIDVADGERLLNAGAAVFVDSGMNEVQITRFPTDERLTILDTKRYTGCILSLADRVVLYIQMRWIGVRNLTGASVGKKYRKYQLKPSGKL